MLRRYIAYALIIAIFFPLFVSNAFADAWTQPAGKGIVVATASMYHTDTFVDRDGHRVDVPSFYKMETRGYAEYGMSESLTLGVNDALMYLSQKDNRGEVHDNVGESGLQLFARRQLWAWQDMVVSLQPFVSLPAHHRSATSRAPVGAAEEWQSGVELQSGYGFDAFALHHYVTLGLGWRVRHSQAHDQLMTKLAAGIALHPKWQLRPEISFMHPMHLETDTTQSVGGVNDYALTKAQLQLAYQWSDDVDVVAGAFYHMLARNTGNSGGLLVSIEKRW
jgi:hypothetical protein